MSSGPTRAVVITGLALVAAGAIGWADYVTGVEVGFSLFYLVAIVTTAWLVGARAALLVGATSAVLWAAAELAWSSDEHLAVVLWNGGTRLAIFGGIAWLVATVRADRRRLLVANERLREMVARETEIARTDPLTGLPNWRGLTEHLERDMERARQSREPLSILYVDLDGFKGVNDRHGHGAGDRLLRETARVLREAVRASDVAARVGGDEFVILMPGADATSAGRAGHRIIEAVRRLAADPITALGEKGHGEPPLSLGASVGVACFTRMPETVDELVHYADAAMYRAKEAGKGQVMLLRFDDRLAAAERSAS